MRYRIEWDTAENLFAERRGTLARGCAISRGNGSPQRDEGQHGAAAPLREVGAVLVEIATDLVIGDSHGGVRDRDGAQRDVGDARRVALILPNAPETRVREVHSGRNLLEELLARNLGAIVLFEELRQPLLARHGTLQQALILLRVEPALGLEIGILSEVGMRHRHRRVLDLAIRHGDSTPLVFPSEEDRIDDLLERDVLDPAHVVLRQPARSTTLLLLSRQRTDLAVPAIVSDVDAVHGSHGGAERYPATAQAGGLGEQEEKDEGRENNPENDLDESRRSERLQHGKGRAVGGWEWQPENLSGRAS